MAPASKVKLSFPFDILNLEDGTDSLETSVSTTLLRIITHKTKQFLLPYVNLKPYKVIANSFTSSFDVK